MVVVVVVSGFATIVEASAIAAASILAKTVRDDEMVRLHEQFPQYGLNRHKGYPTAEHLRAIERHGVCIIHRRSFAPVRKILQSVESDRT